MTFCEWSWAGSEDEKRAWPRAAERGTMAEREVVAMRAVEVRRVDCMIEVIGGRW